MYVKKHGVPQVVFYRLFMGFAHFLGESPEHGLSWPCCIDANKQTELITNILDVIFNEKPYKI